MAIDINALYGSLTDNELAGLSSAREMNAAFPITRNGVVYNFLPDGAIETIAPTDATLEGRSTGATLGLFSPTGEAIVEPYFNESYGETSGSQMLGRALLGAGLGAMLGPAGFGLSTPAAAATGSGLTAYSSTGNIEDALKAAALGGAAAYGFQEFVNPMLQQGAYDQAFAAADAANMANAGLDANTIAANLQTYVDPATATSLANSAATQAGSLAYANQLVAQGFTPTEIATALTDLGVSNTVAQSAASAASEGITQIAAQDLVSNITYQPQVRNPVQASPGAIEVTGTAVQPGLLTAPAAAAVAPAATGLLGAQSFPVPSESVPVQTTTAPAETQISAPAAAATGGLLAEALPSIEVTGNRVTGEAFDLTPAASLLTIPTIPTAPAITNQTATVEGSRIPNESQAAPVAAAITAPTPSDRVIIENRPIKREEAQILAPVAAGTVAGVPVADVTVPRSSTGPIEGSTTVNPLLALGLLGLAGTALAGGGSTGAPVDQAAYDAIARGRSPVYPRGEFTPISLGGLPGMGGMGEIGAYDYFGPYYGAGRFGARPQAFALPGLLGPNTGLMATPSRSAAV